MYLCMIFFSGHIFRSVSGLFCVYVQKQKQHEEKKNTVGAMEWIYERSVSLYFNYINGMAGDGMNSGMNNRKMHLQYQKGNTWLSAWLLRTNVHTIFQCET